MHGSLFGVPRLPSLASRLSALLLVLPLTISAAPKDDEPEIWYQVEVIVFEQQDSFDDEQSRRDIQLSYPDNVTELVNPALAAIDEQLPPLPQALPIDTELGQLPELDTELQLASAEPLPLTGNDKRTANLSSDADPLDAALQKKPAKEQPFEQLPYEVRQLNPDARAIDRRNNYRVLYHQAWRQPGIGRQHAPWILVRGGERYGPHFELEGSIRFVKSRYRHIETNLWLTKFDREYGQQREVWPTLPAYPVLPPSEPASGDNPLAPALATDNALPTDDSARDHHSTPLSGPAFVVKQINQLKTSRRMKKEEIHYLDHPRLGAIVKVTTYEVPEPTELEPATAPADVPSPVQPTPSTGRTTIDNNQ